MLFKVGLQVRWWICCTAAVVRDIGLSGPILVSRVQRSGRRIFPFRHGIEKLRASSVVIPVKGVARPAARPPQSSSVCCRS